MGRAVRWVGMLAGAGLAVSSTVGVGIAEGAEPGPPSAATGVTVFDVTVPDVTVPDVRVPDVRCSTPAEAQLTLQDASLVGQAFAGMSGVVLSQSPAPGEVVTAGSTVYYALQPAGDLRLPVPDLRGRNLPIARRILARGCLLMAVAERVPNARVTGQSPAPAALARAGTRVRLVTKSKPSPPGGATGGEPSVGHSKGANATTRTGWGRSGWLGLTIAILLVLTLVFAATLAWLRVVRPRRQVEWVSGHVTALAGAGSGSGGVPVVTHTVWEPGDQDHRFTWLARPGTTSAVIDEGPS